MTENISGCYSLILWHGMITVMWELEMKHRLHPRLNEPNKGSNFPWAPPGPGKAYWA